MKRIFKYKTFLESFSRNSNKILNDNLDEETAEVVNELTFPLSDIGYGAYVEGISYYPDEEPIIILSMNI